ncbi:hypothetical protein NMG60_11031485 [Bertholletia excelsa]
MGDIAATLLAFLVTLLWLVAGFWMHSIWDKIFEHLSQDQEHAATLGVPSKALAYCDDAIGKVCGAATLGVPAKALAYCDDAIGKVCGAEHLGLVCGSGTTVCPSSHICLEHF